MKNWLIILLILLTPFIAFSQSGEKERYDPTAYDAQYESGELYAFVESYKVTVYSYSYVDGEGKTEINEYTEYYLTISNEEAREKDSTLAYSHIVHSIYLLHPVQEVYNTFFSKSFERWHYLYQKSFGPHVLDTDFLPLLIYPTWKVLPHVIKHVLRAFGVGDPDLLLISYGIETGTVKILFHPETSRDKGYYEKKLKVLLDYFSNTDYNIVIPLENPVHKDL